MAFKVALVQMRVDGGNKRANLARARKLLAEAAGNGAALAILYVDVEPRERPSRGNSWPEYWNAFEPSPQ